MSLQAVQDGSIEQTSKQAKRYIIMVSHGRSGSTLTGTLINNYYSSTLNVNSPWLLTQRPWEREE